MMMMIVITLISFSEQTFYNVEIFLVNLKINMQREMLEIYFIYLQNNIHLIL